MKHVIQPVENKPKSREAKERLTALATQLGPGAQFPTVVKLRESLSISPTTLNSVLQEMELEQLIERRHGVGVFVSSRLLEITRRQICLLWDANFFEDVGQSPFWNLLLSEMRSRADSRELLSLHIVDSFRENEPYISQELVKALATGSIHGLLCVGLSPAAIEWITEKGAPDVPMVCFAAKGPRRIEVNTPRGIELCVAELKKRGCRRIGCWLAVPPMRVLEETLSNVAAQKEVFRTALQREKLSYKDSLVASYNDLFPASGPMTADVSLKEQGFKMAQHFFASGKNSPDGLVITDDLIASGALIALQRMGVDIGHDVQIVSHANKGSSVLMGYEHEVIRVEFDPAVIVQTMFSMLAALQRGEQLEQDVVELAPVVVLPD